MTLHPLDWLPHGAWWVELPGYLGAVFVVVSFLMKTMIRLRLVTMLSNMCFIGYAYLIAQYPTLVLHLVLLPLNALRIWQMVRLTQRVRAASQGEQTLGALKPFMRRQTCRTGEVVFRKGDTADRLYYLVSGAFHVIEVDVTLRGGAFVGELGLLAASGLRTQTLACTAAGELLSISYEHVSELYFQNPDFGYHFLRLAAGRLFANIETLNARIVTLQQELAVARGGAQETPAQPS